MRVRHFLLFALVALAGCGGEAVPEPPGQVRPRDPAPKVVRHAFNHEFAGSAVAEVEVANAGGAGPVRVRVDQGERRWEQRFPFAEREQRTVSLALPGAGDGYLMVTAHGEAVPWAPKPAPPKQPKEPGFFSTVIDYAIYGAVLGLVVASIGEVARLVARRLRKSSPPGTPAVPAETAAARAGCSACGKRLTKTQRGLGRCAPCRKKAAGL